MIGQGHDDGRIFQRDVLEESQNQPVLVDFWAPWCGPCKQLAPVLEKVVRESRGRVKLVKMNIDEHPSIAGQLGIQSIPRSSPSLDGQPVDGFMGALPESQIARLHRQGWRVRTAPGRTICRDLSPADQEAARRGRPRRVRRDLCRAVARAGAGEPRALAGLAEVLFDAGDNRASPGSLPARPCRPAKAPEPPAAAPAATRRAGRLAGRPCGQLERRWPKTPKDHQARFDLALLARNASASAIRRSTI
jgi:putative thioredoxin